VCDAICDIDLPETFFSGLIPWKAPAGTYIFSSASARTRIDAPAPRWRPPSWVWQILLATS